MTLPLTFLDCLHRMLCLRAENDLTSQSNFYVGFWDLSQNRKGFVLLVEESKFEWVGLENYPIFEIIDFSAFDNAVKVSANLADVKIMKHSSSMTGFLTIIWLAHLEFREH